MAYKSEYYDPVKAHEYYEEHKKLKGRQKKVASTSSLNETGQKAAAYVQKKIGEKKQEELNKASEEHAKNYREQTRAASEKVDAIYKKFSRLTPAQKKILGPMLIRTMTKIKDDISRKRNILYEQYMKNVESINDKYLDIYNKEVEAMGKDSSMVKSTKTTSTTTSKSSNTTQATTSNQTTNSKAKKTVAMQLVNKRR